MALRLMGVCLLLLLVVAGFAEDMRTVNFAMTPTPGGTEMAAPRVIVADAERERCYVLDTGLNRVVAFTPEGRQAGAWSFATLGVADTPQPADPMLPVRLLAVGGGTVYLVSLDRPARTVEMIPIDGPGARRTVTLPDTATYGAVLPDAAGRLCIITLRVLDDQAVLSFLREDGEGGFTQVSTREQPCDTQVRNLTLTGFAMMPDGRFAIGIAQSGAPQYGFIRSWLVQGTLRGDTLTSEMKVTHRNTLLDARGKLLDRFRAYVDLAGQQGYPAKACVPLFTALTFGPRGMMLSGGHTADPFLRVYTPDGRVQHARPRLAAGGQSLATLSGDKRLRLFAVSPAGGIVEEFTVDGRIVGTLGTPFAYDLSHVVSLAAAGDALYATVRRNREFDLVHFDADGRFLWRQRLVPPAALTDATPLVTIPSNECVLVGWRQSGAVGIGWVDSIMEDGLPGMPFWNTVVRYNGPAAETICPTPLLRGENGRVYIVRETADGPRLQAFSLTGAFLQQFPVDIKGITQVAADGSMAWAHPDGQSLVFSLFNAQGGKRGWARVPRPASSAQFLPAFAGGVWGWLTSTKSLLQFDARLNLVEETTLLTPEGNRIDEVAACTGDGNKSLYLALPGRIVVVHLP